MSTHIFAVHAEQHWGGHGRCIKGSQAEIRPSAAYTLMRKVKCILSSHSRQSPVWFWDLRNAVRALSSTENQQRLSYGVYVLGGRSTCSSSKHLGGSVNKEVTSGMDLGSVWVIVNSWPGIWAGLVSSELFREGDVENPYTSGETKCLVCIPETPKGRCDEQRGMMSVSLCDSVVESHCTLWNFTSLCWWCPVS